MTGEEQLPFDEKMMKELNKKDNNITGNSGSVGLHARTSVSKEESKLWSR